MKLFDIKNAGRTIPIVLPSILIIERISLLNHPIHIRVTKQEDIAAVKKAMENSGSIFIRYPGIRKTEEEAPIGTIARILRIQGHEGKEHHLLIEGKKRAEIKKILEKSPFFNIEIKEIVEEKDIDENTALHIRTIKTLIKDFAKEAKQKETRLEELLARIEDPLTMLNFAMFSIPIPVERQILIFNLEKPAQYLPALEEAIETEIQSLSIRNKIQKKVKEKMERSQKEYILNEHIKEIRKELGQDISTEDEISEIEKRIEEKGLSQEAKEKAYKELSRLKKLQPLSPEAGVARTYIDWLLDIPWQEKTEDNRDIDKAKAILDADHYNLKEPKERILDFIAVKQLSDKLKGPILCFVGPPGTGKTSLGKSLAHALSRKFVRISLGGVRDEAEIRGHRRTYVGALPGKIIQGMKSAGTINPVFLLDEIDKMSNDFRGDPSAALLEVLDPEQNHAFFDHYIGLPYDLSSVMFIATANSLYSIPHALRDRMEIIEVPGYSDIEKIHIAEKYLIPKQKKENGLEWAKIRFKREALQNIIHQYTMESGVRELERQIARVMRQLAREAVKKEQHKKNKEERNFSRVITEKTIEKHLGPAKYIKKKTDKQNRIGLANGLAWTEVGGRLLPVEAVTFQGAGRLILTGSLGDIMKESARTALSFLQNNARKFNLGIRDFAGKDIHLHVPEGAIPKDGPSAGITITAAILSSLTNTPVKADFAITGEITLTGRVLPVGGIKEKVLAAQRHDINNIILPEDNLKDTDKIPQEVQKTLTFYPVNNLMEALKLLFGKDVFNW
ncbi:endopeptidase La [Spirochaetia bacterium 38H-sp]|uniref:Lon protease n=1 Tax=Rarispira pelagica TaxID=3141764 RepID=A0ABU9UDM9_9SPIR